MRATGFVVAGTIAIASCGRIGFDEGVTPEAGERARAVFAVGEAFACALRDGDVYCWGTGGEGQLGDGNDSTPALTARRVPAVPKAVQVAAARYHACIVSVDAKVWCWGGDEFGRLGNLPGGFPTDPAVVPLPGRAVEVSLGADHGCAILETGAVWCWGRNFHGQLGRGFASAESDGFGPAAVLDLTDALHVSLDDDSSCALRRDRTVWCWGDNNALLIDTTGADVARPRPVAGLDGATVIAVGGDHVCALIDGRVGCRGEGESGQLGDGRSQNSATVAFGTLDDFVNVESSDSHTCAVRASGGAMCWGQNDNGVLGDGTITPRGVPADVANLDDAIAIATDHFGTCAMRADGRITCWGWGARGLLGDGRSAVLSARNVPALSGVSAIAAGIGYTCTSNGVQVMCWGTNELGQLGSGTTGGVMATPQIISFAWPATISALVAGEAHTCALLENREVYCWGDNRAGQLGTGTGTSHSSPVLVSLPKTTRLVAGLLHTCALGADDMVRCWGANTEGQIGDGTTMRRDTPVVVVGNVNELAAGDFHACTRSGGQVSCWGSNAHGEIGDGTQLLRASPVAVVGVVASDIAAGGRSSCAREATGVLCWGLNESNVLDLPSVPYFQPTPARTDQPALFAIGGATACSDNTCWGANRVGQVGAGTFGYFGEPTVIDDLPQEAMRSRTAYAISATHACAIVVAAGRTVWCWGENTSGEVGIGSFSAARSPETTVIFP